jgi:hypothetical protein
MMMKTPFFSPFAKSNKTLGYSKGRETEISTTEVRRIKVRNNSFKNKSKDEFLATEYDIA